MGNEVYQKLTDGEGQKLAKYFGCLLLILFDHI